MSQVQSKTDRRIAKTKDAIECAFVSLIEQKGFFAVKISEIIQYANINRGTFYLHYEDKYDLLEKMTQSTLDDIVGCIRFRCANKAGEAVDNPYVIFFTTLLEYMAKNTPKLRALFSIEGENSFRKRLSRLLEQNLTAGRYLNMSETQLKVPLKYWRTYSFCANVGVIEAWLADNCPESPAEIAEILTTISIEGAMRSAGHP